MAIRMKTVVTYRTTAQCPTHARTEIPIRDLNVVIDEPEERGGTNMGATPTETALTALIACTNVIGHKNARKLGVDLGTITIDADCKFDRRGVLMEEEIDLPFPEITLTAKTTGSELNRQEGSHLVGCRSYLEQVCSSRDSRHNRPTREGALPGWCACAR